MAYNTPIKIVVLVSKVHARALDSVNTSAVKKCDGILFSTPLVVLFLGFTKPISPCSSIGSFITLWVAEYVVKCSLTISLNYSKTL